MTGRRVSRSATFHTAESDRAVIRSFHLARISRSSVMSSRPVSKIETNRLQHSIFHVDALDFCHVLLHTDPVRWDPDSDTLDATETAGAAEAIAASGTVPLTRSQLEVLATVGATVRVAGVRRPGRFGGRCCALRGPAGGRDLYAHQRGVPVTARLNLVVLRCADLALSQRFYEALLGVAFAPERHGGVDHLAVDLGGVVLELYPLGVGGAPSRVRVEFGVDDLTAVADRLGQLGSNHGCCRGRCWGWIRTATAWRW